METRIQTKQQAYNHYAELMEKGNECSRAGYEDEALIFWNKANEAWDIYFYWDEEHF